MKFGDDPQQNAEKKYEKAFVYMFICKSNSLTIAGT